MICTKLRLFLYNFFKECHWILVLLPYLLCSMFCEARYNADSSCKHNHRMKTLAYIAICIECLFIIWENGCSECWLKRYFPCINNLTKPNHCKERSQQCQITPVFKKLVVSFEHLVLDFMVWVFFHHNCLVLNIQFLRNPKTMTML